MTKIIIKIYIRKWSSYLLHYSHPALVSPNSVNFKHENAQYVNSKTLAMSCRYFS